MKRNFDLLQAILLLYLTGGLLAGCVSTSPENPTATSQQTSTLTPTSLLIPTEPYPTDTPEMLLSMADLVEGEVSEEIYVAAPGPESRVASPLVVEGIVDTALGGIVKVQLMEFDPFGLTYLERLLAEETIQVVPENGTQGAFRVSFAFSPQEDAYVDWVSVKVLDPETGAAIHITTVPLMLLKSGQSEITSPESTDEAIMIAMPQRGDTITGGSIALVGTAGFPPETTMGVILCRTNLAIQNPPEHKFCGSVYNFIAQGNIIVAPSQNGDYGEFSGTISYKVEEETPARLVVYAEMPTSGGILHLSSVEVLLEP